MHGGTGEVGAVQCGHEALGIRCAHRPGAWEHPARRAGGHAQEIGGTQSGAHERALLRIGIQWHHMGQRSDEMRSDGRHESRALHRALPGDRDITVREVAQAAVDQLAGPPRRAEGEVAGLDEHHIEPAACGIECDSATRDAAPDHQQVGHMAGGQQVQVPGPSPGIEIG